MTCYPYLYRPPSVLKARFPYLYPRPWLGTRTMTSWYLYLHSCSCIHTTQRRCQFPRILLHIYLWDGLGLGSDSGPLDSDSAWTRGRGVPDSELARNWGHWNRNWLGLGLGGLGYSPGH
ncbi:hypothetical protein HOLleu_36883 [Holothuria leucospilota]|uniref:Uncharacterized protein n=1 Tax=Holothuria leucospilota TaxID=206669 RepID=A0A9Q0YKI8_HOLLE|nr:hypothetical protein HOLleu_36883 [Holothuria leucospilota]